MLIQEDAMEIAGLLKQGLGLRNVARRCGGCATKARNGTTSARFGAASSMRSPIVSGIGWRLRRRGGFKRL